MRILHVFKDYFPPTRGGIEQHVHDLVHSIDRVEFAVLTSSRSRRQVVEADDGVRVVRAPEYARPVSTPITPAWSRLLRESGADLFHFHMPNPFGELAFLAARAKAPMVVTYHADIVGRRWIRPLFLPFQQRFLRRAARIIVSSPPLLRTTSSLLRHADRARVIPFGVDPGEWEVRPPEADELRARHPGPLLLFLGRLAYYKGVDVLIEAMRRVDATLLVVGDGPKRREWEALAASLALRDRVVFTGEIADEERSAYYHAADAFVLPSTSRAETFGIAMLEAMACGTPVISTELGTGTSWVNENAVTGVVVDPGDPAALAGAVKGLLADKGRRLAMGEAASRRVGDRFTKEGSCEAIAALYSEVLSSR